jgi:CDP-diacylglycerol--serine O-phosphatidyltransferase
MNFLYRADSHFNLANMFTFANLTSGLIAIYLATQGNYVLAVIFVWIGGAFDIFDGKMARKHGLSNEFGIQLDSYADFLSFVLTPVFIIFISIIDQPETSSFGFLLGALVSLYYIISGLRRLIQFNINAEEGQIEEYFTGMPTPMGAIVLWLIFLGGLYIYPLFVTVALMAVTGWLLNSKVKIRHP